MRPGGPAEETFGSHGRLVLELERKGRVECQFGNHLC